MKKDQKYYGEVWFPTHPEKKHFAIISFDDDNLLLETNLIASMSTRVPKILGSFIGLGHLTFQDCRIQFASTGITEVRIYNPKYTFISGNHFIDETLNNILEFSVINDTIVNWVHHFTRYDTDKKELQYKEFSDEYIITERKLKITIRHYLNFHSKRSELNIKNKGSIIFELEEPVDILGAISIYDQFQKMLQLLFGSSSKFERFSFKCPECNEWQEIYFNDKKLTKSTQNYVHTEYEKVKGDLDKVLIAVYSNENFKFCLDKLMENFITKQVSHNKRFTNSIATFEAYSKLYSGLNGNNLSKSIKHFKEIFILIGKFSEEEWKLFPSKIVRSRDFHIHSNIANKKVYSEYELLFISFLFDFVVGYLLVHNLKVSKYLLQKFIRHGNNTFERIHRNDLS